MITAELLFQSTGIKFDCPSFSSLGLAESDSSNNILSLLADAKYAQSVNNNPNIKGAFVTEQNKSALRTDIVPLVVEDPKWCFFTLVGYMGANKHRQPTVIAPTADIHPSAVIAPQGVVIGDNVCIEPNVTVMPDVIIGNDTLIRAGAVIGADGFEHKRTGQGILSVTHDGEVVIGRKVEIGSNNFIAKDFSYRKTIIGNETKTDALVHYAHGVQCGERCLIAANATIAGNVSIGDDVWIGPAATVSNRLNIGNKAYITIGAVVVRNVKAGEQVTGNFAMPHTKFMNNYRNGLK